jgi:hypothetical protein
MSIDNLIWFACLLTQTAVIALLFYRRVWRTLPIFCAYCIWDILSNIVAYLVRQYDAPRYF